MEVYVLTCIAGDYGNYGVFTSPEKATEYALQYGKEMGCIYEEETIWDGFEKRCYFDEVVFEITKTRIDDP